MGRTPVLWAFLGMVPFVGPLAGLIVLLSTWRKVSPLERQKPLLTVLYESVAVLLVLSGLVLLFKSPTVYYTTFVIGTVLSPLGMALWIRKAELTTVLYVLLAGVPGFGPLFGLGFMIARRSLPLGIAAGLFLGVALGIAASAPEHNPDRRLVAETIHAIGEISRAIKTYYTENGRVVEAPDAQSIRAVYDIDVQQVDRTYRVSRDGVITVTFIADRRPQLWKDPLHSKTVTFTPKNNFTRWEWGGTLEARLMPKNE
jgi:hypothetical protein